jgi:NADH-quinone oxidoreductase subunit A
LRRFGGNRTLQQVFARAIRAREQENALPPTEASNYQIVALLILTVGTLAGLILAITHLVGPQRLGRVKQSTYESGVDPKGDARRRFNIRFYLVGLLFIVFDVELVFLYPWAVLFPRLADPAYANDALIMQLKDAGYGTGFFALCVGMFFLLLTVGFVYEWRKGIFRWD